MYDFVTRLDDATDRDSCMCEEQLEDNATSCWKPVTTDETHEQNNVVQHSYIVWQMLYVYELSLCCVCRDKPPRYIESRQ